MSQPSPETSFEQALLELDRIVHDLEDGQTGLEESLARYEKGIALLKSCYGQLQKAEQRILMLTGVDAQDKPLAKPFSHSAAVEVAAKESNQTSPELEKAPDEKPPEEKPPSRRRPSSPVENDRRVKAEEPLLPF